MLFYLDNWESTVEADRPATRRLRRAPGRISDARGDASRRASSSEAGRAAARPQRELRTRADGAPHARRRRRLHAGGRHRASRARSPAGRWRRRASEWRPSSFAPRCTTPARRSFSATRSPAGRGIEDGEEVLDIVARHPATAQLHRDEARAPLRQRRRRRRRSSTAPPRRSRAPTATFAKSCARSSRRPSSSRAPRTAQGEVAVRARRERAPRAWARSRTARRARRRSIAKLGEPIYGHQAPNGWPETRRRVDEHRRDSQAHQLRRRGRGGARPRRVARPSGRMRRSCCASLRARAGGRRREAHRSAAGIAGYTRDPETGENPLLASAAALDTTPAMAAAERPADADEAMMMLPEPGAGARARGPARDRAFGRLQPPAKGLALIVGLALGSPEFQRR